MLDNSKSTNFAAYGTWNGAGQDITDPYEGGPSSKTIQVKIRQSSDDAEEAVADGAMDLTGGILDLIRSSTVDQVVGLRFQHLNIPPGATISSAIIRFKSAAKKTSAASLTINGENIDNASIFTSAAHDISARPNTAATVSWATIPSWSNGAFYETPELAAIVQEIVNRGGWTANNAMAFKLTGTGVRQALAYDGDQINPPQLIVSYTFIPPTPIQYYGYFDPSSRYTYDNKFVRSATGEWSGNWLNWLSMRRIDVLRKVPWGGLRPAARAPETRPTLVKPLMTAPVIIRNGLPTTIAARPAYPPTAGYAAMVLKTATCMWEKMLQMLTRIAAMLTGILLRLKRKKPTSPRTSPQTIISPASAAGWR